MYTGNRRPSCEATELHGHTLYLCAGSLTRVNVPAPMARAAYMYSLKTPHKEN